MKAAFVGSPGAARDCLQRLEASLSRIGEALGRAHCTLGVMLTDDAGIAEYNRRFRGIDEPTDVLSFESEAGEETASGHYLGDLVISVEQAERQAAEHAHGLAEELEVLLLHGALHLMGHDHETDAGEMRALESRVATSVFGSDRGLCSRAEDGPDGLAGPDGTA